ncbi:MAG: hypothetical protein JW951_04550, partial [Lentisphaerae bacterium]|nr:hypothetical protein [Lentisphaerota bacterium]
MAENETDDATPPIEEGELTPPGGETLPQLLKTEAAVHELQRYVETERRRNRKILVWTSTISIFIVLLVLVLFVSVGIFVMRHTRRTAAMVGNIETQTAAYVSQVTGVTTRLGSIEAGQTAIETGLQFSAAERVRENRLFRSNLERFSRWVAMRDTDSA